MENDHSSSSGPDPKVGKDFASAEAAREASFRMPPWGVGALILALVALGSVGYISGRFQQRPPVTVSAPLEPETPDEIAKRPLINDFILTDAEGKQKKLSEYRGKVVILSFWASWCTPCLVELPTFAEIEQKFGDRGLAIVAVNVEDGNEGKNFAKDFWAKRGFTFPTFFDTDKSIAQIFDVSALPANFVLDREGRLVYSGFGANDWASTQTTEFLEGILLEGTAAATTDSPAGASSDDTSAGTTTLDK